MATVAIVLLAGAFARTRQWHFNRRRSRIEWGWRRSRSAARRRRADYVARDTELSRFRQLVGLDESDDEAESVSLLVVYGPPDSGKRTLLRSFRDVGDGGADAPRCSNIVDLASAVQQEQLLDELVSGFDADEAFSAFLSNLDDVRATRAGAPTPGEAAGVMMERTADALKQVGGPAAAAGAALTPKARQGPGIETQLEALERSFYAGLAELVRSKKRRVVLLFIRLDEVAAENEWVLERLFPNVAKLDLLTVVGTTSLADPALVRIRKRFEQVEDLELSRVDAQAARAILRAGGISDDALLDELVRLSDGLMQRLESFRRFYAQHPEVTRALPVPPEAKAAVDQREVGAQLDQITSVYLRTIALAVSPLRWFNAPLLRTVSELAPESADGDPDPTALIGRERPAWIRPTDDGWTIGSAETQRALVDELRRHDPKLHEAVALCGARYHLQRLRTWEQRQGAEVDEESDAVFDYAPHGDADDRFSDRVYVAELGGWLYQVLSLAPARTFPVFVGAVAEAMYAERWAEARQLLAIEQDVALNARQRHYVRLLVRVVVALQEENDRDAEVALEQLVKTGPPTALVGAVVANLRGVLLWRMGHTDKATAWFQRAHEQYGRCAEPHSRRMRWQNVGWLANHLIEEERDEARALTLVDDAIAESLAVDDQEWTAELHRVKAVLAEVAERYDEAHALYTEALEAMRDKGRPEDIALIRLGRGRVYRAQKDYANAESDLKAALDIYASFELAADQTTVLGELLGLSLERGDKTQAEAYAAQAVALRPNSATYNMVGNAFYTYADYERAADWFLEAARGSTTAVYVSNLCLTLESIDDETAERMLRSALEHSQSPRLHFELARTLRRRATWGSGSWEASYGSADRAPADTDQIVAELRLAVELEPQDDEERRSAEYLAELVDYLIELHRLDEARHALGELETIDPEAELTHQLRTRLEDAAVIPRILDDEALPRPLVITVSDDLLPWVETPGADFLYLEMFPKMGELVQSAIGVRPPGVLVRPDPTLPAQSFAIALFGVPRYTVVLQGSLLAAADPKLLGSYGIEATPARIPWDGGSGAWVPAAAAARLAEKSIAFWDPRGVIVSTVARIAESHAADLLDLDTVAGWLAEDAEPWQLGRAATVLRRLLSENVPLVDSEAVTAELNAMEAADDAVEVAERIRARLAPGFIERWAGSGPLRAGYLTASDEVELFRHSGAIIREHHVSFVGVERAPMAHVLELLARRIEDTGATVLVVPTAEYRPYVRSLVQDVFPALHVVAQAEIEGGPPVEHAFDLDLRGSEQAVERV